MFIKSASKNNFARTFIYSCLVTVAFFSGLSRSLKSQERPNLAEPFKKCRVYGSNNGWTRFFASDNELNIIITTDYYSIVSYNPNTNLENWKSQTGGKLETDTISDENNLYFVTSYEDESKEKVFTLNSISLKTGITNWQRKLPNYSGIRLNQIKNQQLLFITAEGKSILAVRKENGETRWTKDFSSPIFAVETLKNEQLYILLENRLLRAFAKSGEIFEEIKLKRNAVSKSILKDTYLLLGNSTGDITKISAEENKNDVLWKTKAGASISGLIEYQGEVLATSLDNFIYLFSGDNGNLKWKKRVAGRINIKPLLFGTFAVVVNSGDNSSSVVDLRDGRVVNQILFEPDIFFSGQPFVSGIYVIFQTSKGLYFFVNTSVDCK